MIQQRVNIKSSSDGYFYCNIQQRVNINPHLLATSTARYIGLMIQQWQTNGWTNYTFQGSVFEHNISINELRLRYEDPPFLTALPETSFNPRAHLLISSVSATSEAISLLTALATSSLTIRWSLPVQSRSSSPTFHSSTIRRLSIGWSKNNGKVSIGTPAKTASSVEFIPQCVRKPPTEGWHKTFNWLHHGNIMPLVVSPTSSRTRGDCSRRVHKNLTSLAARPNAISSSWDADTERKLPRETYNTEFTGWESNQVKQSPELVTSPLGFKCWSSRVRLGFECWSSRVRYGTHGPIGKTGQGSTDVRESMTLASSSYIVVNRRQCASLMLETAAMTCFTVLSLWIKGLRSDKVTELEAMPEI